jgi:hypothetical protein
MGIPFHRQALREIQEHYTEDGRPNGDKMERQDTRSTLGLSDNL